MGAVEIAGDDAVEEDAKDRDSAAERCTLRYALLAFGWLMVALGAVGILLPGFPGTVFLLIALWAFSKSSERFHSWLYDHKLLGPPIRNWHQHRVIPASAKIAAVATMAASFAWVAVWVAESWMLPAALAACLIPVAGFILTRPIRPIA